MKFVAVPRRVSIDIVGHFSLLITCKSQRLETSSEILEIQSFS